MSTNLKHALTHVLPKEYNLYITEKHIKCPKYVFHDGGYEKDEKTLYHGSENVIKKPLFGIGKSYNDYGVGFYCTESMEMAKEWGVGRDRDGFANCYELDCDGLTILNLNDPKYTTLHVSPLSWVPYTLAPFMR
ncbi:MAG: DUF3990 domain-containing protein [Clostridiales bacterium]|nr:DUF3990 domain-containing protein [Clostridiales bacterium]